MNELDDVEAMQIPQEISIFLESCLVEKGFDTLPEETKQQMIDDLAGRLNKWLLTATFSKLSEVDQVAFGELMDKGSADQNTVEQFFRSRLPDIDRIYTEAMLEFKRVYVGK